MPQVTGTVLVIGASGFVGRHLALSLLADGRAVRGMARDPDRVRDLADAGAEVVRGDVLEPASLSRAMESVAAVYVCIHTLSPQGASSTGQDFMDVEECGLRNVVDACRTSGVRRLVYLTSIGVAPDAPSAWVRGRSAIERLLFDSGLDVTVIRPGMIVGPGGTGFDAILRGARGPAAVVLGAGTQRFRTIAVDDLAYYLIGVLDDPRSHGHHYDVGSDDVLTTAEMIDLAADHLGRRHPVKIHLPRGLLRLAAPLIERLTRMPRGAMTGLVDSLQMDMTGDPAPIRALLHRPPRTYHQALDHTLTRPTP